MSMAAGEYVSVSSQSDTEKADLAREGQELSDDPRAEHDELTEIYVKRGVDRITARLVAQQLMEKDPLAAHARDELGISEITTARPVQAALTSAVMFSVGATRVVPSRQRHAPREWLLRPAFRSPIKRHRTYLAAEEPRTCLTGLRAQIPSCHRGFQPTAAPPRAIRINMRFDGVGSDADSPLTGVSTMAIWVTAVLHCGATPQFFRRFEKCLILKDFCAVQNRWRRGRGFAPPLRRTPSAKAARRSNDHIAT